MKTEATRWSDKIKLVVRELEDKIQQDADGSGESAWPAPEDVAAWTAERAAEQPKGNSPSRGTAKNVPHPQDREQNTVGRRDKAGNSGQYCGVSVHEEGQSKESVRRRGFAQAIMLQAVKAAAFALATIALLQGIGRMLPDSITVSNTVNGRELPIYCVQTDEKKVALSFDAAWGNQDTQKILDILKKHNTKATFFMTGGWVESYPDDVKRILADGHDLGNHSENHKNMSQISDEEKKQEIMDVHTKVQELTGYEMFLFRPPYGDYDNSVIKTAKACGYYPIQWDVETFVINKMRRGI